MTARSHPPRLITAVLDDVLKALAATGQFRTVQGGRVQIAWIQRRECYQVTLDFRERDANAD